MSTSLPPALVLTAGRGTRLAPLSDVRAKPAVPVAGTPLVARILRWLVAQGVQSAVLNLHHRPETVTRCVGHGTDLGIRVRYSWEPTLLGTAGGPRRALPLLGPRFFIINGDTLTDVNLGNLAAAHYAGGGGATLTVTAHPAHDRYGSALVDTKGWVRGFVPPGAEAGHHFVGVQLVEALVFADLEDGRPAASIGGLYDRLAQPKHSVIRAHRVTATFHEVGTPADYLETSLGIAEAEGHPALPLGERSRVHATASLTRTAVWDDVAIGAGCRLVDCVVTDGVRVPENDTYEGQILITTGGANGTAAALRTDRFHTWPIWPRPSQHRPASAATMGDRDLDRNRCAETVMMYLARVGLDPSSTATHELAGDASDRRYVRVLPADGKSRIVLVHRTPFDPDTLPFLNVARLLQRIPLPLPAVLGHEADLGVLVLEDLGDVTLQDHLLHSSDADRWDRYVEATELIIRMQRRGRKLASKEFAPFGLAFDERKLVSECDFFVQHFLIAHRDASLSPTDRAALAEEFTRLAGELAGEPRVLCHRDYHSRNLMLHDGQLHVIDFQDARMGPDTYDLVSLLRDSYIGLDRTFVEQMIESYLTRSGSPDDPAFAQRFDQMSMQRHLKALGTFGYQTMVLGRDRYLDAIPRTLGYVRDVLERRPRFSQLRTLLAAHLPELR